MSTIYLSTYKPLGQKKKGRQAADQYQLPYYVDGSCRREPDFEHPYPTISALCHGGLFAPRLKITDKIVFLTSQYPYPPYKENHWRLTAILTVDRRFDSHDTAAEWFTDNGLSLPSNCMVPSNPPLPFEKTHGEIIPVLKEKGTTINTPPDTIIRRWDVGYKDRAKKYPAFLVCSADYLELHNPPPVHRSDLLTIFDGKVPGTQNPKRITTEQLEQLHALITKTHSIAV